MTKDLPCPILGVKSTSDIADSVRERCSLIYGAENALDWTELAIDPVSLCDSDRERFDSSGVARGSAPHEGLKISVQYFSNELFVGSRSWNLGHQNSIFCNLCPSKYL